MKDLKGTKTLANLAEAFAGESQARNKYTYFASKARKEGYNQIAEIFEETANNEKEHAKLWYKLMAGIGSTTENLKTAAEGEHGEWTEMYKRMADEADAEGFEEIARMFRGVAAIEKTHEERYVLLNERIGNNEVFARTGVKAWICTNCGHIHYGETAPQVCPVCAHPQAYFFELAKNY